MFDYMFQKKLKFLAALTPGKKKTSVQVYQKQNLYKNRVYIKQNLF